MKKILVLMILPVLLYSVEEKLYEHMSIQTEHTLGNEGRGLSYVAEFGNIVLDKASVTFISYTVPSERPRPITFCFNGGPGSSSVWLNLGAFGPRTLALAPPGIPVAPPELKDNPYTLLDMTDLVFIDPVSTGYSEAKEPKCFYGVDEDVKLLAEFIRTYVTQFGRWDSLKYLAGESYGTTRAVGIASELYEKQRMSVNGLILLSTVLDFGTVSFAGRADLAEVLILPSYTAAAWYYKKLAPELQALPLEEALVKAEGYAKGRYAQALMEGDGISVERKKEVAEEVSRYSGLSADYVFRSDLRIPLLRFAKELLRPEKLMVGRMDVRFTSLPIDECADRIDFDPSLDGIIPGFQAAMQSYMRDELKIPNNEPYVILQSLPNWDYKSFLNVSEQLRDLMIRNVGMQVFVGSGYYDLATPYFASDYTMSHLGAPSRVHERIRRSYYEAGHMMYLKSEAHRKMKEDLKKFYQLAR